MNVSVNYNQRMRMIMNDHSRTFTKSFHLNLYERLPASLNLANLIANPNSNIQVLSINSTKTV